MNLLVGGLTGGFEKRPKPSTRVAVSRLQIVIVYREILESTLIENINLLSHKLDK
jgi:septum formation topological specificity factor MinE